MLVCVCRIMLQILSKNAFFFIGVSPVSSKSKLSWPSKNLDKRFDHILNAHYPTIESTRIKKKTSMCLNTTHRNRALLMKTNNEFWESEIE